jgi:hypothetical protein
MNKRLIFISIMFIAFLAVSVHAARTVFVLNNLFVDFSVTSQTGTYTINDSYFVHGKGRINVENDGKYILTNAQTYYNMLYSIYGNELTSAWYNNYDGSFEEEVVDYYNQFGQLNISEDLDLKSYWEKRKAEVFWDR